jgi:hypothetical protein
LCDKTQSIDLGTRKKLSPDPGALAMNAPDRGFLTACLPERHFSRAMAMAERFHPGRIDFIEFIHVSRISFN